jgi:hypothetical protein
MLIFSGVLRAQLSTGNISGTVKDSSGAVLPGATVTVLDEDTGVSRTVQSDAGGHFSALSLAIGTYRVTATFKGFETIVHTGILLTVGREEIIDLTMQVGAVSNTVNVTDKPPLVEGTTGSLTSLVNATTIRDLPLNGRSYDQLALIQPGATPASPGAPGSVGNAFSFGSGTRFSVGGLRPNANLFLMDGTDINDAGNGTPGGAAGTNLGVDTILEFRIYTSSFKAEFGHSMGSVTTAVTRSGTNSIHGTVFEFIRNSVLDAANYFDVTKPSFKRNQFGGVLGGPIKKDKAFYFVGYEGLRQGLGTTLFATVPNAAARAGNLPTETVTVNPDIVPFLNLYPLPNGRDFGDGSAQFVSTSTTVTNEDNVMGRLDFQLTPTNSLFGRYTFDKDNIVAPLSLPFETQVPSDRRQYLTIGWNHIFKTQALNSLRFGYNTSKAANVQQYTSAVTSDLSIVPGQPMGTIQLGSIGTSGSRALAPLGPSTGNGPFYWDYTVYQGSEDYNWIVKKHTFKAGANLEQVLDNFTTTNSVEGIYTFKSFDMFLEGIPSNFQASFPLGLYYTLGFAQTLMAGYIQDDYQVTPRLMLNYGLRWEATTDSGDKFGKTLQLPSLAATATVPTGSYYHTAKRNFEPRFGFAWQPFSSGKTVVRGGAGIYQNQILPYIFQNMARIPPFGSIPSIANPSFPNAAASLASVTATSFLNMDPYEKTPTAYQYNLSVQRQFFTNNLIQVDYAGSAANHLQTQEEGNTPIPTVCSTTASNCPAGVADGALYYPAGAPRRNPAWGGIRYFDSNGRARYDSFTVLLRHDSNNGLMAQVFYTFAKDMDDSSGSASAESQRSPSALKIPGNPKTDWAQSDYDQKHQLVGYLTYPIPYRVNSKAIGEFVNGWTVNGIGSFRSGLPFTPILAASVSRNLSVAPLAETPNLVAGFSTNPNHGVSAGCPGFAAGTRVGTAANWFDPCAFSLPITGTYGNLKRNTIIGPGYEDVDLALQKQFEVTRRIRATFKTEMFNILNHPNFGLPNLTALASSGAANPSAGTITYTVTSSRQLQFALKVSF